MRAEMEMIERISRESGEGRYEGHVTTRLSGAEVEGFRAVCEVLGASCLIIELPYGDVPVQPMASVRVSGTLQAAAAGVARVAEAIRGAGFAVLRVKLEAEIGNPEVPEGAAPDGRYFEFHARLHLDAGGLGVAREVADRHGGRLSRNALRVGEGRERRFVTLRLHGVGKSAAGAACEALVADLQGAGLEVAAVHREYALFDSEVGLDRGWI